MAEKIEKMVNGHSGLHVARLWEAKSKSVMHLCVCACANAIPSLVLILTKDSSTCSWNVVSIHFIHKFGYPLVFPVPTCTIDNHNSMGAVAT